MVCNRVFRRWAVYFALEFYDSFEISLCPEKIQGTPTRHIEAAPRQDLASSMFHCRYSILLCFLKAYFFHLWTKIWCDFLPLSPLWMMDGVIKHWCTLILEFSLYLFGISPWLIVYHLHYSSVQPGLDFPLVSTSRENGYTPTDLKLLNNLCICSYMSIKLLWDLIAFTFDMLVSNFIFDLFLVHAQGVTYDDAKQQWHLCTNYRFSSL